MIAAALWALDLTTPIFVVLRFVAAVGGAFAGWFAGPPIARFLCRLAFHRPLPGWLRPVTRLSGSLLFAFLVYFFLPLGGGPGFGWGPGAGGAPGPGQGTGKENGVASNKEKNEGKDPSGGNDKKMPPTLVREPVDIELIGGERYKGDGRYYLMRRKEPPRTLDEVEAFFKEHKDRLEVHIILTEESVGTRQGALGRLRDLTKKYKIPTVDLNGAE
ncbi:MAG: hypothetical protein L0Y72_27170 [Gemmataceae bacterium]|nr:hypothetical protein [Gemmataceae bacterium]MCI0742733.1 hypothetical protein [Gemmataceae bacterium]